MVSTINERISIIISELGYRSVRQFANKIGIAQTSLNDVVKKNAEPKFSTIDKILKAEPSISSDWLLTGKGEMLKKEYLSTNNNSGTFTGVMGGGVFNNSVNNNINVESPEAGFLKIIYPDGKVELYKSDSISFISPNEVQRLKDHVSNLEKIIEEKENTIKSNERLLCSYEKLLDHKH